MRWMCLVVGVSSDNQQFRYTIWRDGPGPQEYKISHSFGVKKPQSVDTIRAYAPDQVDHLFGQDQRLRFLVA